MTKLTIAVRNFAMVSKNEQLTFCCICCYLKRLFSCSDYVCVKTRIIRLQIGKRVEGCLRGPFCGSSSFPLIFREDSLKPRKSFYRVDGIVTATSTKDTRQY